MPSLSFTFSPSFTPFSVIHAFPVILSKAPALSLEGKNLIHYKTR